MAPASSYNDYVLRILSNETHPETEERCPICFDGWQEVDLKIVKTHCGHSFHEPCLLTWFEEKRSCPCCRAEAWQTLQEYAEEIEDSIYESYASHDAFFGEESILQLTSVDLSDTQDPLRFAMAVCGLNSHLAREFPSGTPLFVHYVRLRQIVEAILTRYGDGMEAKEWLGGLNVLYYLRERVAAFGSAPEYFPAGMHWTGAEVWDEISVIPNAVLEIAAEDVRLGIDVAADYKSLEEYVDYRLLDAEADMPQSLQSEELVSLDDAESDAPIDNDLGTIDETERERYLRWESDSDEDSNAESESDSDSDSDSEDDNKPPKPSERLKT